MMTSTAVCDDSGKAVFVRVCDTHGVITAAAYAPGNDFLGVDPLLLVNPVEDRAPQPVGRVWIIGVSWTVTCARDLYADRRETVGDVVRR